VAESSAPIRRAVVIAPRLGRAPRLRPESRPADGGVRILAESRTLAGEEGTVPDDDVRTMVRAFRAKVSLVDNRGGP